MKLPTFVFIFTTQNKMEILFLTVAIFFRMVLFVSTTKTSDLPRFFNHTWPIPDHTWPNKDWSSGWSLEPKVGQCNDAYSAVVIATKLAEALECHLGSNQKGRYTDMGVSENRGTQKWMVKEWKTLLKWMIWGYHYFRKHPYNLLLILQ